MYFEAIAAQLLDLWRHNWSICGTESKLSTFRLEHRKTPQNRSTRNWLSSYEYELQASAPNQ